MTKMILTDKEKKLLSSIVEGMDQPGEGWLHEINPFSNDRIAAGVLGSLIKKGLAKSTEYIEKGSPTCYWVEII
jgi:hypothetical protein